MPLRKLHTEQNFVEVSMQLLNHAGAQLIIEAFQSLCDIIKFVMLEVRENEISLRCGRMVLRMRICAP